MKRIAAILLLSVMSVLLIAPLAMAHDPEAQLPACCRAHGKHRCMLPRASQPTGPSFETRQDRCPLFAQVAVPGSNHPPAAASARHTIFGGVASHQAPHAQTQTRYRISHSRAGEKRGPPALFS